MTVKHRNVIWTAALIGTTIFAASVASTPINLDLAAMPSGTSVVGPGAVHPLLTIESSGGNDVLAIHENENPVAFGGTFIDPQGNWWNIGNLGIGSGGFADVGSGNFTFETKQHQYVFTFATEIQRFSVRMVDWSDFMPYGGNADKTYAMKMVAYNAALDVVDTDQIQFSSTGVGLTRTSPEFGDSRLSGDAVLAAPGQPGNFTFKVAGPGITRVELRPKDRASMDPHMALAELSFEVTDSDGDGVPDSEDLCPNSDLRPFVNTGGGPTSVANTMDKDGCSIQDLVNAAAAAAKNKGQYVSAITQLANQRRKAGLVSEKQSTELKTGAAKKK